MKKKSAEDYLDKLLNSVNDQKARKDKFKDTAKMLQDARNIFETQGSKLIFEEPEEEPVYEEKKSEQEDFLDALLSGAKDTEFGMNRRRPDTNPMYSRRVSKSEAEFLREFEAELLDGDEDLSDLLEDFTRFEESEDRFESGEAHEAAPEPQDDFHLGEVDLAALVNEAADVMSSGMPEEMASEEDSLMDMISAEPAMTQSEVETATEPIPVDEIPDDVFASLFGGGDDIPLDANNSTPGASDADGIDLGNLGEEDLMSLLAGADGLEDIGSLLTKGEATEIPLEEMDAFTIFAEGEMSAQQISAEPALEDELTGKKGKKGPKFDLIGKLKGLLASFLKDDEEDAIEIKPAKAPTAELLSGENADILAELEGLESKSGKKEKKKKDKKEKAPKKAKAAKKSKPKKPAKPKKEKKPKEVDNTPPLPKGPVVMIWVMVGSLVALVLLGVNVIRYNTPLANAKSLQNQGHYAEAFNELVGLEIKEKDAELYNQLAVLATVDSEINAYEVFTKAGKVDKAFDSLICAAGRCYINEEDADIFGCLGQLEILKTSVSNELEEKYGMTYEEALEMYKIRHRDDYTIALYKKLTELGIEWD